MKKNWNQPTTFCLSQHFLCSMQIKSEKAQTITMIMDSGEKLIFQRKCCNKQQAGKMVLNLKYAKSVKACQAKYWHLRPTTLLHASYIYRWIQEEDTFELFPRFLKLWCQDWFCVCWWQAKQNIRVWKHLIFYSDSFVP